MWVCVDGNWELVTMILLVMIQIARLHKGMEQSADETHTGRDIEKQSAAQFRPGHPPSPAQYCQCHQEEEGVGGTQRHSAAQFVYHLWLASLSLRELFNIPARLLSIVQLQLFSNKQCYMLSLYCMKVNSPFKGDSSIIKEWQLNQVDPINIFS